MVRDVKREVSSRYRHGPLAIYHKKTNTNTKNKIKPTENILPEIETVVAEELTKIVGPEVNSSHVATKVLPTPQETAPFKGYVLEKAMESIPFDERKTFPKELPCPRLSLRHLKHATVSNTTCRHHKPKTKDCTQANKAYKRRTKLRKCKGDKPIQDLCVFRERWRSSSDMMINARCDLSPCGEHPVHLIPIDNDFGILASMEKWLEFSSAETLENYLPGFVAKHSIFGLQFCYLRCRKPRAKVFIKQILSFPPIMGNVTSSYSDDLINFNFINLKSVSRSHFYRSLPKTIQTMRRIVRNTHNNNATVLDYEMLQSTAPDSYHSIKGFLSGMDGLENEEKHEYGISWFYGSLKSKGYYTVLQDDSCWYDEWGTIFSNYVYQNKTPNTLVQFAQQWDYFNDLIRSSNVDDMGLSNTACDVYKQYKSTNQLKEKTVCFSGKPYTDYFLNYTTNLLEVNRESHRKRPIFSFTNLGVGNEISGTRIRQIDDSLAHYVKVLAQDDDTLTVIFSDHGPKSTKHSLYSMEGRKEMYDSVLFVILPKKVAEKLQFHKTHALITNQDRLVTTVDLHDAVLHSIGAVPTYNPESQGIFSEIPKDRDCTDLIMKPTAICKCEHWYRIYPDNHVPFTWLAELGLGEINNAIQEENLSANNDAGFAKCQRLVGHSFRKIRYRKEENQQVVTMDIFVKPQMEIFEVQVKYPVNPLGNTRDSIEVSALRRVSSFSIYKECKDKDVPLDLCICKVTHHSNDWKWIEVQSKHDMLQVIARGKSFGSKLSIKNLHGNCLLLLRRKHDERTEVYEIANICKDKTYHIRLAGRSKTRSITSRNLPLSKILQPFTVHFLFSVYHLQKPYGFYVKTSYKWTTAAN